MTSVQRSMPAESYARRSYHGSTDEQKKTGGLADSAWYSDSNLPTQRTARNYDPRTPTTNDWSLVPTRSMERRSRAHGHEQVELVPHVSELQNCTREAATDMTRLINAFHEATNNTDGHISTLRRQLVSQSGIISDQVLPNLIQAIRLTIARPASFVTQVMLVNSALNALQPGVQTVLIARELLDDIEDAAVVSRLTTLSLTTASALLRLREAARAALVACVDARGRDEVSDLLAALRGGADQPRRSLPALMTSLAARSGSDVMSDAASSSYRQTRQRPYDAAVWSDVGSSHRGDELTSCEEGDGDVFRTDAHSIAAVECCDAAYRQIQMAAGHLEPSYWPPLDDARSTQLLSKIVSICYELGSSITDISRCAKRRKLDKFITSLSHFADSVAQLVTTIPQISQGSERLLMTGKAIRHCACSLVTSARWLALEPLHSAPYRAYSAHSRALSKALTQLVYALSTTALE